MSVIRLDLDALVRSGQLSQEDAARLLPLAQTGRRASLAVNLLLIFGSLAVAAAAIALVPNAATGLSLAVMALAGAEFLRRQPEGNTFGVLAAGLALMGTLGLAGWSAWQFQTATGGTELLVTLILAAGAVRYQSSFLAVLGMLSLSAVFGTSTGYWHASYALFIEAPTLTIIVFGALAAGLWRLRPHLAHAYHGLSTAAARTALILVHLAFWIGALWGDRLGDAWGEAAYGDEPSGLLLSRWGFAAAWAAAALAMAVLARRGSFVSVSAIVFLGIHFYTQYFELLGANPTSLLAAGLILVGLAVTLNWFFRRAGAANRPVHHTPSAE